MGADAFVALANRPANPILAQKLESDGAALATAIRHGSPTS